MAVERLVALGCDEAELDRRVAIPRGNPWRRVPFEVLCDLVEAGDELTGEPNLGLRLRYEVDARQGGVLALLMLACPDLRAAIRRLERYHRIAFDAHRVTLEEDARRVVVSFPGPERPALRHLREWFLADALGSVETLTGSPGWPSEVTFSHERPESADELDAFFGCEVRFGAPRTSLLWPEEVVSRRLLHASDVFLAAFEEQARELVAALPMRRTWVETTRAAIMEGLPDAITIEHVAARLRVSPRTLQRRLQVEGSSLAAVLTDVRRELSATYLAEGRDVAEVSYLLGYATSTSFHRAFRSWYDTTPSAYRDRERR